MRAEPKRPHPFTQARQRQRKATAKAEATNTRIAPRRSEGVSDGVSETPRLNERSHRGATRMRPHLRATALTQDRAVRGVAPSVPRRSAHVLVAHHGVGHPLLLHHGTRRVGPAEHLGPVESRFPHRPRMSRSASSSALTMVASLDAILGTICEIDVVLINRPPSPAGPLAARNGAPVPSIWAR